AGVLYQFIWGTYCDWYIEFTKPILTGDDEAAADETRRAMGWALGHLVNLLNPLMPFITEELWEKLGGEGLLIDRAWSAFDQSVIAADAAADGTPVTVEDLLDELDAMLDDARAMPLSASVLVNRGEVTARLRGVRDLLPEELARARWVVREEDAIRARAEEDAAAMLADARAESARLVSEQLVVLEAEQEAERIRTAAEDATRAMRLEAEDYVDAKLANFEVVLQKTLATVERGRERLRGRLDADELAADDLLDDVAPDGGR
ncbi:MAG: class I tRNA ligase family protein, partial [Nitriliruptoraceae bacterium]